MNKEKIIECLQLAYDRTSAEMVESAVASVNNFGYKSEFVPYLIKLLEAIWHFRHEDIVLALQHCKDNKATKTLLKTATTKFDYLEYNSSYSLARKCTWALADIGTVESKQALLELTKWHEQEIAGYAQKRLDNLEKEKNRKPT